MLLRDFCIPHQPAETRRWTPVLYIYIHDADCKARPCSRMNFECEQMRFDRISVATSTFVVVLFHHMLFDFADVVSLWWCDTNKISCSIRGETDMSTTWSNFRELNEGPPYSQSGYKLFSCKFVCVLSAWALHIHSNMSCFIAFLYCLNSGHNLLPGKYSSVHLLIYRQFNMKTAMKEAQILVGGLL